MLSQILRTEAIILRRTNYGEADRILSLLTPEYGKLTAIAKGIRRPKSKLAGGLELFATCDLTIRQGRGDMGLVTSARLIHFYGHILHDYDRLQLGYDCLKKLTKVVETVAEPDFYNLLAGSFKYLDAPEIDRRIIELWFKLQLNALLGVGLNLTSDVSGRVLQPNMRYVFAAEESAFAENPHGQFGSEHIKLLRLASAHNPALLQCIGGVESVIEDCLRSVII
jgi:DNA repair protein RecO (recombination protein O)